MALEQGLWYGEGGKGGKYVCLCVPVLVLVGDMLECVYVCVPIPYWCWLAS